MVIHDEPATRQRTRVQHVAAPATTPTDAHGAHPSRSTVLVVAARGDVRGATAAAVAAAALCGTDPAGTGTAAAQVVALHAASPELTRRVSTAERIYVLDPGRARAWWERARGRLTGRRGPLDAPARVADRLALLELLSDHRSRVRGVTGPAQLRQRPDPRRPATRGCPDAPPSR